MSTTGWFDLHAAFPALLGMSLVAASAIAPALLAGLALRRRADLRHAAGSAALAVAILSPALWAFGPAIPLPTIRATPGEPPAPPAPAPSPRPAPPVSEAPAAPDPAPIVAAPAPPIPAASSLRADEPRATVAPVVSWPRRPRAAVAATWLLGSLALLVHLARGLVRVARLRRDARPFADDALLARVAEALGVSMDRLPSVAVSPHAPQPLTLGVFHPLVLLPDSVVDRLSPEALRDVLVHECAHALRRDSLVGLLQRLATALHWPNPFIHALNRSLDAAREDLCDNHALRSARPADYAASLLAVAELRPEQPLDPRLALPILARREPLESRVARLLDPRRNPRTRASRPLAAALTLAALATGLAAAGVQHDGPESPPVVDRPLDSSKLRIAGQVVDEAGVPQPGARVLAWSGHLLPDRSLTTTDAEGRFSVDLDLRAIHISVSASSSDGLKFSGPERIHQDLAGPPPRDLRLALKSTRETVVRVTDADQRPVADAVVYSPMADIGWDRSPRTDARGEATLRLPADGWEGDILAFKPGVGLDFLARPRQRNAAEAQSRVDLILDGAKTVRFRAVDTSGRPIPGLTLAPSTISKGLTLYSSVLPHCPESRATTDADGNVAFDFIPRNAVHRVGVHVLSQEYQTVMESPSYDLRVAEQVVDVYLVRPVSASGRVLAVDGSPAAGILVKALGRNTDTENGHATTTRTAADGSYRLSLFPERTYSVAVEDERFTARSRHQIVPPEGASLSGLDFNLAPGVFLKGRVTDADGRPLAGERVRIFEEGGRTRPPSVGDRPGRSVYWNQENAGFWRYTLTDEDGRYKLLIPPGVYRLPLKDGFWEKPTRIGGQGEYVYDYKQPGQPPSRGRHALSVTVRRDGPRGPIVPQARVEASAVWGRPWFSYGGGETNARGRLEASLSLHSQIEPGPIHLYARSPDGSFAGLATAGPEDAEATIILKPAASIRGRVVLNGETPIPSARISVKVAPPESPESAVYLDLYCDFEGRFAVTGIPVGSLVKADAAPRYSSGGKAEVVAHGLEPIALPDLSLSRLDPDF
ncbi:M56 family metallopeptidase [Paludisphaera soli]|uniref:M56 family metallopeptidase n=1 Tax=Paludisphaera soli TaxID=2712865 RepID=UPI0013EC061F|nr:carboxypeptidase regulatory-like domain-containing protein [Paludisphaera soli]